jgi:transcriptional regulator with XRE-family HTH domain
MFHMPNESAGARLRKYREKRGWSQREMAVALNVSHTHVARLEQDEVTPGLLLAYEIRALAGISPGSWLPSGTAGVEEKR